MNSALITGVAGFVGSKLCREILKRYPSCRIFGIDNLVRTNGLRNIQDLIDEKKLKFYNLDLSYNNLLTTYPFSHEQIRHCFHLAATRINRCGEFPQEGHNSIANSGFNVVQYCNKHKCRMFFSSTASVYNSPRFLPIDEDDQTRPKTIYGAGKLYTEHLMNSMLSDSLGYVINRFFSVYGPGMDNNGAYTEVIFNWLNSIKNGNNEIIVFGDPNEKILDLVYVDDVVDAILLTYEESNNEIFNVSTQYGCSLSNLIKIIEKVTNTSLKIKIEDEYRSDIEKARVGDIRKLKSLGWEQKISLEEGIKRTWEWIQTL